MYFTFSGQRCFLVLFCLKHHVGGLSPTASVFGCCPYYIRGVGRIYQNPSATVLL